MRFQRRKPLKAFNTMMHQSNKFSRTRKRMTLDATSTKRNLSSRYLSAPIIMIAIILRTRDLKIFKSRSRRTKSITMMMWNQETLGESNRCSRTSQRKMSVQTIGELVDHEEITTIANKMRAWIIPSTMRLIKTWASLTETQCLRDHKPINLVREETQVDQNMVKKI